MCLYIMFQTFIESGMNIYHKALLCWNFQRDLDRTKVITYMDGMGDFSNLFAWGDVISFSSDSNPQSLSIPPQPQQTMRYMELDLRTKISRYYNYLGFLCTLFSSSSYFIVFVTAIIKKDFLFFRGFDSNKVLRLLL